MDFDNVPVGTRFGQNFGNTPGQVVLAQDGIQMSFENYLLSSQGYMNFVEGQIDGQYAEAYFPSRALSMDNINVRFDFTQVGFDVDRVSLEYVELGPLSNLSVNGQPLIETFPLNLLPSNVAPGVTMLTELLDASTGRTRLTFFGDIDSVLIGGQEFGVDTVIAIPEPATLALLGACGAFVVIRRRRSH